MTERIFNFSAGPAVLPVPVLEKAREEMLSLPGVGMSVMEISHRSKTFDEIHQSGEEGLREILGMPDNYHILFLQGGASLQFSMIPMNFLPQGGSADYIMTGSWGKKAIKEAKRSGAVNVAATMADSGFTRVPSQEELKLDPNAAYVHLTTNETIEGVEWKQEPEVGDVPLVADASSDILLAAHRGGKYALIYAGAQKNMGPSGVTLVILRDDMLEENSRRPAHDARLSHARREQLALQHAEHLWHLHHHARLQVDRRRKADSRRCTARTKRRPRCSTTRLTRQSFIAATPMRDARSMMNVTFRLPSEELEKKFAKEATAAGLDGLKGHRSVGGIRASIYNAFPASGRRSAGLVHAGI